MATMRTPVGANDGRLVISRRESNPSRAICPVNHGKAQQFPLAVTGW
jgi:hypothetical protein